ncbi:MAG: hypothetical protein QF375_09020 [Arenicellales bacterium]|jgi:hypothetical protein|nr:hypothetical protein [Arenicellales bacterium]MDP6854631.1 hypothetical protein [Arenicellales bacterium]MDP6948876.1 hypothetical protein [Arenicellales bacterium]|tara:strand:- start:40 stop:189 length:150 start_codon:yes stop_codon:yes gene_type:complete
MDAASARFNMIEQQMIEVMLYRRASAVSKVSLFDTHVAALVNVPAPDAF